jgi:hypothetical protein
MDIDDVNEDYLDNHKNEDEEKEEESDEDETFDMPLIQNYLNSVFSSRPATEDVKPEDGIVENQARKNSVNPVINIEIGNVNKELKPDDSTVKNQAKTNSVKRITRCTKIDTINKDVEPADTPVENSVKRITRRTKIKAINKDVEPNDSPVENQAKTKIVKRITRRTKIESIDKEKEPGAVASDDNLNKNQQEVDVSEAEIKFEDVDSSKPENEDKRSDKIDKAYMEQDPVPSTSGEPIENVSNEKEDTIPSTSDQPIENVAEMEEDSVPSTSDEPIENVSNIEENSMPSTGDMPIENVSNKEDANVIESSNKVDDVESKQADVVKQEEDGAFNASESNIKEDDILVNEDKVDATKTPIDENISAKGKKSKKNNKPTNVAAAVNAIPEVKATVPLTIEQEERQKKKREKKRLRKLERKRLSKLEAEANKTVDENKEDEHMEDVQQDDEHQEDKEKPIPHPTATSTSYPVQSRRQLLSKKAPKAKVVSAIKTAITANSKPVIDKNTKSIAASTSTTNKKTARTQISKPSALSKKAKKTTPAKRQFSKAESSSVDTPAQEVLPVRKSRTTNATQPITVNAPANKPLPLSKPPTTGVPKPTKELSPSIKLTPITAPPPQLQDKSPAIKTPTKERLLLSEPTITNVPKPIEEVSPSIKSTLNTPPPPIEESSPAVNSSPNTPPPQPQDKSPAIVESKPLNRYPKRRINDESARNLQLLARADALMANAVAKENAHKRKKKSHKSSPSASPPPSIYNEKVDV